MYTRTQNVVPQHLCDHANGRRGRFFSAAMPWVAQVKRYVVVASFGWWFFHGGDPTTTAGISSAVARTVQIYYLLMTDCVIKC